MFPVESIDLDWKEIVKLEVIWVMEELIRLDYVFYKYILHNIIEASILYGKFRVLEFLDQNSICYKFHEVLSIRFSEASIPTLEWIKQTKGIILDHENMSIYKFHDKENTLPILEWYSKNKYKIRNIQLIGDALNFHGTNIMDWLHENKFLSKRHIYYLIESISGCYSEKKEEFMNIILKLYELGYDLNFNQSSICKNSRKAIIDNNHVDLFKWLRRHKKISLPRKHNITDLLKYGCFEMIRILQKYKVNLIIKFSCSFEQCTAPEFNNFIKFYEKNPKNVSPRTLRQFVLDLCKRPPPFQIYEYMCNLNLIHENDIPIPYIINNALWKKDYTIIDNFLNHINPKYFHKLEKYSEYNENFINNLNTSS